MPSNRRQRAVNEAAREAAEHLMAQLAKDSTAEFTGTVLLDGMFDNANYWYRLSLLRTALGLGRANEIGVTGPYMSTFARRTFDRFGVRRHVSFDQFVSSDDRRAAKRRARQLADVTTESEDVLMWSLPFSVPAGLVYDGILKEQRAPSVDPTEPLFPDRIERALVQIYAAARLLDQLEPNLLVLSHSCNVNDGALCYLAAQRGIPTIVAFGNYGVPRFCRIDSPDEVFDPVDCPRGVDLEALPGARADALAQVGRQHLHARFAGTTDDIGGQYAFARANDRLTHAGIASRFGWDPTRPLIAIYAANWFDYPHYLGMSNFCDFADFITTTVDVVTGCPQANWLFRRHPADDFYGGTTLKDVMPAKLPSHIALSPDEWNGSELMGCIDGAVTYHGTIGIEAAAVGKPVLVADRGWYHDGGFVTCPGDRAAYCSALRDGQWLDVDVETRRRQAEVFAGWYFAVPDWQCRLICRDDSAQWANYEWLTDMMTRGEQALQRELKEISAWWTSGSRFYHTEKMRGVADFTVSNVRDNEDQAA